ncbi:MAG TPA: tetratricopeptide repeat protein [Candidatus Sulfobium mesophilum]|nr:tetratricopeptide repeat protein [Candidatus Sulfobium mesophilum]
MTVLPTILRYFKDLSPIRRIILMYGAIFALVGWANFTFVHYRIIGNALLSLLPDTGVFMMYLWIILLFDEFVYVLQSRNSLAVVIKNIKKVSFAIIAIYALIALALRINSISFFPTVTRSAKLIAISKPYRGSGNFGKMTVQDWDDANGRIDILRASRDEASLFNGEDVEVKLRRGILGLQRIIEVRKDLVKFYTKMLQVDPDSKNAIKGLTVAYSRRNQLDEALKWYGVYTKRFTNDDNIGFNWGIMLIEDRQYSQAVTVLSKVIEKNRTYKNLYLLGYALAWAGEKYEAEKYLREATKIDPTDYSAFYSLGYVYYDTGRYSQAKEAWSTALLLMPNFPEVESNLKMVEKKIAASAGL